jgi:tRNA dimethylallyltransferase
VVLGATGTGKSSLALALAEELGGEIVGCDALQVYRHFDAATAKPTAAERSRVPHHLVDCVDPRRDFNMADFVRSAERIVADVAARGKIPIVAGGTGLYLRGLLRGIVDAPPRDAQLRRRLRAVADRRGAPSLHRWLGRLDPGSAARLAPGDTQRLVRALELALSGEPTWSERLRREGSWESGEERYPAVKIGLEMDRDLLNRRLDARVEGFFEAGLVQEVERLLEEGVPRQANAFKAIGYREILAGLERGLDVPAVIEEVKKNTRRYAKRQRTWFRKEPNVVWLDVSVGIARLVRSVKELWRSSV